MTGIIGGAIAAVLFMLIVGFFFATGPDYLVGVSARRTTPLRMPLSTLVIAALLRVFPGSVRNQRRGSGLSLAAVVCVRRPVPANG